MACDNRELLPQHTDIARYYALLPPRLPSSNTRLTRSAPSTCDERHPSSSSASRRWTPDSQRMSARSRCRRERIVIVRARALGARVWRRGGVARRSGSGPARRYSRLRSSLPSRWRGRALWPLRALSGFVAHVLDHSDVWLFFFFASWMRDGLSTSSYCTAGKCQVGSLPTRSPVVR